MRYARPGTPDSVVHVNPRYENFIGGKWMPPTSGRYRTNLSPATGKPICEVAGVHPRGRGTGAGRRARGQGRAGAKRPRPAGPRCSTPSPTRSLAHKEELAVAESWDNGKPVRETLAADIPLAADHFRYFAAAARAEEGSITEIDKDLVAYHFHEPLGVVGQIIPFNFPLLMAAWKLAPALAAGNCPVIKPASPTPWSILKLAEVIGDILPPGVLNIVNGPGAEIGKALATSPRIAKVAFTGETVTGRLIMQYAAQNIIPVTLELGGKSPNIFFSDVMAADDEFLDKAVEGLVLYAFNKGEVCTCPSRALIQDDIYDEFMARCLARIARDQAGRPAGHRHHDRPAGLRRSRSTKIASYVDIGREEGAEVLIGGGAAQVDGDFADGYFFEPTVLKGHNKMRVFQEEIFGPVLAVTTFNDEADALAIANDTPLRPRRRRLDPRRQPRLPDGPRHQGRPGLDQLLPPVPGRRRVRRVQGLRHRPGEPQDDAGPLQPDQEPPGQLQHQTARPVLSPMPRQHPDHRHPGGAEAIAALRAARGPVMFVQSGGCCAGTAPMCYPLGEFLTGAGDLLLGEIDGCPFYMDARSTRRSATRTDPRRRTRLRRRVLAAPPETACTSSPGAEAARSYTRMTTAECRDEPL